MPLFGSTSSRLSGIYQVKPDPNHVPVKGNNLWFQVSFADDDDSFLNRFRKFLFRITWMWIDFPNFWHVCFTNINKLLGLRQRCPGRQSARPGQRVWRRSQGCQVDRSKPTQPINNQSVTDEGQIQGSRVSGLECSGSAQARPPRCAACGLVYCCIQLSKRSAIIKDIVRIARLLLIVEWIY